MADLLNLKALLLAFMVFVPLERLVAMHHDQSLFRAKWTNDLIYALANGILVRFGLGLVILAAIGLGAWGIPQQARDWIGALPFWVQLPTIILISDIGFYTAHRLFHKIPWLWKFHAVHHSIEELDWLAAHRVHPVDQILTKAASLAPIFALGFSAAPIAVYFFIYQWQSLFIHSNVGIGFGPLRWLIASPQFHHWHHANQTEAFDKNFAGQLSFLDAAFGTLHMPGRELPARYGTDDPVPDGYIAQLAYPFTVVTGVERAADGSNGGSREPEAQDLSPVAH
jgi:sterol desaturase/sphingolipid hydroxylase (fatty acid hydroxylase superfamily)